MAEILAIQPNNNPNLFVTSVAHWEFILMPDGQPREEFTVQKLPVISFVILDNGEGFLSVPVVAGGMTMNEDYCYALWQGDEWSLYLTKGVGEESLREFIIEDAKDSREWALKRKAEKPKPKPGKVHQLKRPDNAPD
jgi:hypothetical protein